MAIIREADNADVADIADGSSKEYALSLGIDLGFQDFEQELEACLAA